MKEKLADYVESNLPKVKLVRSSERLGLIRARMLGAKHATGDVSYDLVISLLSVVVGILIRSPV